jgi:Glyoxalase-like domain
VAAAPELPRLRQAVIAAVDLEPVTDLLRERLGLGEPFCDPGVGHFGLRNAVFALENTFLEVVSPVAPDTAAGRLIARRGGDCGYMLMFQVDQFDAARDRARAAGVREVFEVRRDEIAEVHLHPRDMRGAIVSLSRPVPPSAWPWGGPGWERRSARARVAGATVAVSEPEAVAERWRSVLGGLPGVRFVGDDRDRGLVEIVIATRRPASGEVPIGGDRRSPDAVAIGGVRFVFVPN